MARYPGVTRTKDKSAWRARYRDAQGKEHQQQFATEAAAKAWRHDRLAAVAAGSWIDPALGRTTFEAYARQWLAATGRRVQSHRITESRLRLHAYPALGARALGDLRHSEVRAWLTGLERTLAPWTVYGIHSTVRSVLNAAVADRLILRSPFERIPLKAVKRRFPVVPWTVEQVGAVLDQAGETCAALFALGAATGLRGSELRGLTVDDVDFLRRTLTVRQQLVTTSKARTGSAHAWGPPKTASSERTLDVPRWALDLVAAHLARRPAQTVTLPVVDTPGETERTGTLIFTTATGRPISRTGLHAAWNAAVAAAVKASPDLLPDRAVGQGPHALRHHVASVLIAGGETPKVVQAQLGHANVSETLDTYTHLFPDPEGRVRKVLDDAWQAGGRTADSRDAGETRADQGS